MRLPWEVASCTLFRNCDWKNVLVSSSVFGRLSLPTIDSLALEIRLDGHFVGLKFEGDHVEVKAMVECQKVHTGRTENSYSLVNVSGVEAWCV